MGHSLLSRFAASASALALSVGGLAALGSLTALTAPAQAVQEPSPLASSGPAPVSYVVPGTNITVDLTTATLAQVAADPKITNALDSNVSYATTFGMANVLPGDSLTWYSAWEQAQVPVNDAMAGGPGTYTPGAVGGFSPQGQYLEIPAGAAVGATPTLSILAQGTDCATGPGTDSGGYSPYSGALYNAQLGRWCMGPVTYKISVSNIQLSQMDATGHGSWLLQGKKDAQGSYFYSGPENAATVFQPSSVSYYAVVNPSLIMVKQVCSVYTNGVPSCNVADDPATVAMATQVDTTGAWVDASQIPVGVTQVQWRLTAFNTGNIQLRGVHVASDSYDAPVPSSAGAAATDSTCGALADFASVDASGQPIMVNDPANPGTQISVLNMKDSASQTCVSTLAAGTMSGSLRNTAQLTSTFYSLDPNGANLADRFTNGVPSNKDDAVVWEPNPGIKLTKWVCSTYDAAGAPACVVPTAAADLAAMGGIKTPANADGTWAVQPGVAPAGSGWVKAAKVPYGADAKWLMLVTNTGNTNLVNVSLPAETTTGATSGTTDAYAPASVASLASGASAAFTTTTHGVRDTGAFGAGNGTALDKFGEPAYAPGTADVVNTAQAQGTPADDTGAPLIDATGAAMAPMKSNTAIAEVRTDLPVPDIKLTKWVCSTYDAANKPTCAVPANPSAALTALAGYDGTTMVAGAETGGWVKQYTVPVGADASWLVVVTNTGATYLDGVTVSDTIAGAAAATVATALTPTSLAPGASAIATYTTPAIMNTGALADGIDAAKPLDHAEPAYNTGSAVVNTAAATGNAVVTPGGTVVLDASGQPAVVTSNPSAAEVNTIWYGVGDYVWIDANRDGQQGASEAALVGVTVDLYRMNADGTSTKVGSTTTDADGYYWFNQLPAGDYYVQFGLPAGYAWTEKAAGDAWTDSNADQTTGKSDVFTLGAPAGTASHMIPPTDARVPANDQFTGAAYVDPTIDAGVYLPAPGIKLTKWVCATGTGCADPAGADLTKLAGYTAAGGVTQGQPTAAWVKETSVAYGTPADWLIVVTNTGENTLANVTLADAYVNGAGAGALTCDKPAGAASLAVGQSVLFHCTSAAVTNGGTQATGDKGDADAVFGEPTYNQGTDVVNAAKATGAPVDAAGAPVLGTDGKALAALTSNVSAAEVNTTLFAVGDYVWVDANKNGLQDAGEAVVAGVKVELLDGAGKAVPGADGKPMVTTTDAKGWYCFDGLPAGDYQVRFTLPAGYLWTTQLAGDTKLDSDALHTDASQATATSATFTLGKPGTALPHMVATNDATLPSGHTFVAAYIDPTIDAGVYLPKPGIKLTKWVCATGTGCADPAGADLTNLAGYSAAGGITQGQPTAAWVKETSVAYGAPADWLIVVTNTGDYTLAKVTLADAYVNGAGAGALTCDPPVAAKPLPAGQSVLFHCTSAAVTNGGTQVTGDKGDADAVFGEPTYNQGTDVVNAAKATGAPVDGAGHPMLGTDGKALAALTSNVSAAEVNTILFAVGDYVWVDANDNGLQDTGEAVVAGVTVELLDSAGKAVPGADGKPMVTTTDAKGWYGFDGLPAGDYQVRFTLPAGYMWAAQLAGDTKLDSDALHTDVVQATATSATFTLGLPGTALPNMVATNDATLPTGHTFVAAYIDPTIDAGVVLVNPAIAIAKYVCAKGTGCTDPATVADGTMTLAKPPTGWVKQTTVTYNTAADWLILIENTGNVALKDVNLTREDFAAGGAGFTNVDCAIPDAPLEGTLEPGDIAFLTCTVKGVTNTSAWKSGKDIVNTVQAAGTPVDAAGNPIMKPDLTPWGPVLTGLATAEVNAKAKPIDNVGGGGLPVPTGSTTEAAALFLILSGTLLGVLGYRRRTAS